MGRKPKNDNAKWAFLCHTAFLQILKDNQKVTADTFYAAMRRLEAPPQQIAKNCGNLMKCYAAAGYIKKTGQCVPSDRNDSKIILVWERTEKPLPV